MPNYDYKCDVCGSILEIEHPMHETRELYECELAECEGLLHKVFRPAAVSFKGQGWGKLYRVHKTKGT